MYHDVFPGVLELERSTADVFQPLPFHFIEITHLLFVNARDTFGDDAYKVPSHKLRPSTAYIGDGKEWHFKFI